MNVTTFGQQLRLMERRVLALELRRQAAEVNVTDYIETQQSTTHVSETDGVDLATVGPQVTIHTPGKWLIEYGAKAFGDGNLSFSRAHLYGYFPDGSGGQLSFLEWDQSANLNGHALGPNPMPFVWNVATVPRTLIVRYSGWSGVSGTSTFAKRILKATLIGLQQ